MSEESSERPAGAMRRRRAADAIRSGLPDTSPTWELELLLSGAVLVALFQLSGTFDRTFDRVTPHLTRAAGFPVFFAYMYGKAMVLALAATFVLHLASRGYWVGLIGLSSVFPNGVKWDELRYGPITREVVRERLPSLPPIIARLDNFCSALFSFGFLLVLAFTLSLLLAGVAGAIAYVIALVFFGGDAVFQTFYVVMGVLAIVPVAITVADRRFGPNLDPAGRGARTLRYMAKVYYWTMGLPIHGPIMLTLISNTRRRMFTSVLYVTMFGILLYVTARVIARVGGLEFNNYAYFAQSDPYSIKPTYYESLREPGDALPRTPTIQADVIRDPFVRLFIPYVPERHNRAIPATCPGVRPLRSLGLNISIRDGEDAPPDSAAAVLRCFATLHAVTLNGAPLTNLDFRFYVHPSNGSRGVIAYISSGELPRGRNVITVQQVPRAGRRGGQLRPHVITFWF